MDFRERISSAFEAENARRAKAGDRRLTKTDLWRAAEVSSAAATHWFNGDNGADMDICLKLAPLLRVNPFWLFDESQAMGAEWSKPDSTRRKPQQADKQVTDKSFDGWPFPGLDQAAVKSLPETDRRRIEGAIALALAQMKIGLKVSKEPLVQPSGASEKINALQQIAADAASAANEDELVPIRRAAVRIVGGDPIITVEASEGEFDGVIYVAQSWLDARNLTRDKVFAATVTGNSMEPRIREGDLLLINQADKEKRSGQVYGLNHDGKFIVKRLMRDGRRWLLMSDNPDHPPIPTENGTSVIGRVVLMKTEFI